MAAPAPPHGAGEALLAALPAALADLPAEWRGTTFDNSALLGRAEFSKRLLELAGRGAGDVTAESLAAIGNAEDYLRVASNVATMLETALAVKRGLPAEHVFTFASTRMPVAAAPIAIKAKTTVYYGSAADAPLNPMEIELFSRVGADIECVAGMPPAAVSGLALVTEGALGDRWTAASVPASVAGVVSPEALYVTDRALLPPAEVLVVRKRLATPLTTPAAERALQALAGVPLTADEERADTEAVAAFEAHLQTMSGTDADATHPPVSFTAGLPALCSVWTAMIAMGGADVLMCSTAYGGSSQMTDLLVERVPTLRKHTFDIQGVGTCLSTSIKDALDRLAQDEGSKSIPATLLAVEIPTNPDMKVPDMREVAEMLAAHGTETGKDVLLLVDTTFAPASGVLGKLREACDGLPAVAFVSMSKSVSRGVTTAGAVVANHTAYARDVLKGVAAVASAFDTGARPDQVQRLAANHVGVEERCKKAYVECSGLVPQRARCGRAMGARAVRASPDAHSRLRARSPERAQVRARSGGGRRAGGRSQVSHR